MEFGRAGFDQKVGLPRRKVEVRFGSKADIEVRLAHVRFTPKSGHWFHISECPLCAAGSTDRRNTF